MIVGTRGSKLALAQTYKVVEKLRQRGYDVEVVVVKTAGDVMKDRPLYEFRGSGAFVRALDTALARGEIDVAVHSYKDVPSQRVEGTVIAAVLPRESPCDVLITSDGRGLDELESGAIIGTSSLRRRAQFSKLRNDLRFENIRGNLDTRIRKLMSGQYDAIVVAEAGLIRLGMEIEYERFPPDVIVPSPNQGIIAVATRKGEEGLVRFMNDERTWIEATVERVAIRELGTGCAVPAGIYAEMRGGKIRFICEIFGRNYIRVDEKLQKNSAVEEVTEIVRQIKSEMGVGRYE